MFFLESLTLIMFTMGYYKYQNPLYNKNKF